MGWSGLEKQKVEVDVVLPGVRGITRSFSWSRTRLEYPRLAWSEQVRGMLYFPLSDLTLLAERQEGHVKSWMLVCWW